MPRGVDLVCHAHFHSGGSYYGVQSIYYNVHKTKKNIYIFPKQLSAVGVLAVYLLLAGVCGGHFRALR